MSQLVALDSDLPATPLLQATLAALAEAETREEREELLSRLTAAEYQAERWWAAKQMAASRRRGQMCGLVVTIAWLIAAVTLGIETDSAGWATAFAGADLVPLATIFVLGRRQDPVELPDGVASVEMQPQH